MLDTDNRTEFGPFSGFPRGVNHTPVPDPLLAELLERIDDVEELKLALRCVWLLNKKNPAQRFLTCDELYADSTVANMLKLYGEDLNQRVSQITECLTKHGVLLAGPNQWPAHLSAQYRGRATTGAKGRSGVPRTGIGKRNK